VQDEDAPLTVYTIRFTTGVARGAAMSEPYAAVNVCLIGQDGRAALHRVSPVNDPMESRAHTVEMCQVGRSRRHRAPSRAVSACPYTARCGFRGLGVGPRACR
jgi:hypothetical protein